MATTQELLKKINYIEVDIEIQKQILFSIPSAEKAEMEKVIKEIARKKEEIDSLRRQIAEQDPEEYARILRFEEASAHFRKLAEEKKFTSITSANPGQPCELEKQDGSRIPCLVKACDRQGNWTVIDQDGQILEFSAAEVAEKADPNQATPLH